MKFINWEWKGNCYWFSCCRSSQINLMKNISAW